MTCIVVTGNCNHDDLFHCRNRKHQPQDWLYQSVTQETFTGWIYLEVLSVFYFLLLAVHTSAWVYEVRTSLKIGLKRNKFQPVLRPSPCIVKYQTVNRTRVMSCSSLKMCGWTEIGSGHRSVGWTGPVRITDYQSLLDTRSLIPDRSFVYISIMIYIESVFVYLFIGEGVSWYEESFPHLNLFLFGFTCL